jgi:hypothetical protein
MPSLFIDLVQNCNAVLSSVSSMTIQAIYFINMSAPKCLFHLLSLHVSYVALGYHVKLLHIFYGKTGLKYHVHVSVPSVMISEPAWRFS